MIRWLLLVHRYLGIALGVLMIMWCVSGFVMMYVSYPALSESARLKQLTPISWEGCCKIPDPLRSSDGSGGSAEVEMLAGRPVLYLQAEGARPIDLLSGTVIQDVSAAQAMQVAREFGDAGESRAAPQLLSLIDQDQWTVSGEFQPLRPLYRYALGDRAGTEIYVSRVSGRAVQITTRSERFWNWLGAIPHWLYFTELRRHAWLWSRLVIYASLLGCFLTAIGVYLGVRQIAVQQAGRWSPYAGFNLWHHIAGLVFGVFTLAWVVSGLLSMNPWGWLEGQGAQAEATSIHGPDVSVTRLAGALQRIADAHPSAVSMKAAPLNGRLFLVAHGARGEFRFDETGFPAPLDGADIAFLAHAASGASASTALELLRQEDNYYFSHHRDIAELPVYRLILTSGSRYYFDPVSGMLLAKQDSGSRAYRWLHEGLHRLDFTALLRSRPLWDALMLALMAGVTVICVTGAYLGYRRLTR